MKTTTGPQLKVNEDLVDVNLMNNIFIIADGFGGVGIGDIAVRVIKDNIIDFYTNSSSDPDATLPYFYDPKYIVELNVLVNAVHHVFKGFIKENLSRPMNTRAGLSLLIGLYVDGLFMTISIGNCLGLLRRNNHMTSIVKPDTLEEVIYSEGNMATNLYPSDAFGLYPQLKLNISELKIKKADQVLLCTDGIYAYQTMNEIGYILSKVEHTNSVKIQELIDLSNVRGNWDNQSAILLNF